MSVQTLKDLDLSNKKVLARFDFNVPLKNGTITDDTRIKAALPSISYILEQEGTALVMMSHLGRPKGEKKPEFSLGPVAKHLGELLGKKVIMAEDCIGPNVEKLVKGPRSRSIAHAGECPISPRRNQKRSGFCESLGR